MHFLAEMTLEHASYWAQIIGTGVTIIIALLVYRHTRRMDFISFFEQSFDALQEINSAALSSSENIEAAIQSVHPGEKYSEAEMRIFYFHYMRINRLYRAYEYRRAHPYSRSNIRAADRIIKSHLSSVKAAEPFLHDLMERGYPNDFKEFLKKELKAVQMAKTIRPASVQTQASHSSHTPPLPASPHP